MTEKKKKMKKLTETQRRFLAVPSFLKLTCLAKSSLLATDLSTCQKEGTKHSCASHSLAMKEGGRSESMGTSWLLLVEVGLIRP